VREKIKRLLRPKIKLVPGTRLTSFLFITASVIIAAGILIAANIYYNIDTGEVVIEQINRVIQVIRATGGLIVGGTATQDPTSGYIFEVVGNTRLATTTLIGYLQAIHPSETPLRFGTTTGGYYIGFKIPTDLTTTTIYTWPTSTAPQADYVLAAYDTSGTLYWMSTAAIGGSIRQVGDVPYNSVYAFTAQAGTDYGNTLWFHPNATYTIALTAADGTLTANATTIIPAVSGQNYLTLASSFPFTSGEVLFADANGLITGGSTLTFDSTNRILTIGSSGNSGELRIYDGSYYLAFAPTSTMTVNTTYYWPPDGGAANQVLTTDGAGNLSWSTVQGVGGITGSGTAGQVAFFDGTQSITGSSNFTWSTTTNTLTVSGTIVADIFTGPSTATTTITSASGYNILLDPATGKIVLGSGDWIETASGYQIGKAGTQVLREMIPIMGFDLPARTGTTSYVAISRTIESYPFSACSAGTSRVHKLVIRYADTFGSASSSDWQIWNVTDSTTTDTFTVPGSPATGTSALDTGVVYIATTTIPTPAGSCTGWSQGTDTDDWQVQLKLPFTDETIQVYQVFLAAYDEIL